ncbi:hypothetical protein C4D60_Mb04t09800 [Musa balbisiana]|uniref:Uncharacterized protein n=1 Tax=Musa balbisiana TaxID=52838 RepID=A0A4S8KAV1_MUSBA|nr:hypothetical protein C4D60_Mb04t09800 [Musa balbisiana]
MLHRGAKWRQFSLDLPLLYDLSLLLPSPLPNSTAWIGSFVIWVGRVFPAPDSSARSLVPFSPVGFGGTGWFSSGFGPKGLDSVRYQAASDGGSDGSVGGDGGYGGRSDGGSYDGGGHENDDGNDRFFLSWYLMAHDKHPVITKALTSARLTLIGDLICQVPFLICWSLWYLMAHDKHPVITKALTSARLTLIGDLICQLLIDQVSKLDLRRTFVFTFLGLSLVGPTLHFWYLYLSKLLTFPGASGALLQLLLDQIYIFLRLIFSPIFLGVFLSSAVALEGKPYQINHKLQQEWFPVVLANWQLWIPFQLTSSLFLKSFRCDKSLSRLSSCQVLVADIAALVWNVMLSFKAHKEIVLK